MQFQDHLSKEMIRKFNQMRKSQPTDNNKQSKKKQEKLSHNDWLDIMGTKRDTYKRVRGAVRRK
ncbi:hypothetical protein [Cytobacillus kochii]|uniref:hypothetical protein n=1 Tax=Cytobacillus kochii TaxID=859143 RepID=UPI00402A9D64